MLRNPRPALRIITGLLALLAFSTLAGTQVPSEVLSADVTAALDRISADSMRGNLSFIASDRLEGRDTPSRGLDIAAEYIAAQFRRAGLEPAGDDGYFQTAPFALAELDTSSFQLTLQSGAEEIRASANQVSFSFRQDWNLAPTPVVKIIFGEAAPTDRLEAGQIQGKAVLTELPNTRGGDRAQAGLVTAFLAQLRSLRPAVIVNIVRTNVAGTGGGSAHLVDPENRQGGVLDQFITQNASITVDAPAAATLFDTLQPGVTSATISIRALASEKPAPLRNVVGILRGSDPVLADSYVFLTAHYDHVGVRPGVEGDNIFNGANDDGSGTVSVVEIASALATLKERPKRSLVFMTFFGEEKGGLGSRYYLSHPIFPIAKTVADINLEQVGRTDSTEGPQVNNASVTGFDFSDVGQILVSAGSLTGIDVYKHPRNSDEYFDRSDNAALASQGVPAHSLSVAFDYPDYHRPGDHWDKIDYANMARVDRTVALGLLMIANNPEPPKWNEANPMTASYMKAWRDRHPVTP